MEWVLIWLLFAVWGAAMLSRYNRAGTGFILGLLLGPIGVIIAWSMRDKRRSKGKPEKGLAAQYLEIRRRSERGGCDMRPINACVIGNSSWCPIRCVVCPGVTRAHAPMEMWLWEKLIKGIARMELKAGHFAFGIFNDPFNDPFLVRRLRDSRQLTPWHHIFVNGSGKNVTDAVLTQLHDLVDTLCFSFCGYDQLSYERNVHGLDFSEIKDTLERAARVPQRKYQLVLSVVSTAENEGRLDDVKKLFPMVDDVRHSIFSGRCGALVNFPKMTRTTVAGQCGADVTSELIVDYDGKVLMCCNDWNRDLILGDLKCQSLEEIMDGNSFRSEMHELLAAKRHNDIVTCAKCRHASWPSEPHTQP